MSCARQTTPRASQRRRSLLLDEEEREAEGIWSSGEESAKLEEPSGNKWRAPPEAEL
jgi:hypothetical protein